MRRERNFLELLGSQRQVLESSGLQNCDECVAQLGRFGAKINVEQRLSANGYGQVRHLLRHVHCGAVAPLVGRSRDLINHYIAERDDSFAIKHRLQQSALFLVPLAAASQQTCPHYPSQILMIKQGSADKIGMIKKKIALTTNLYVDNVAVFARCTREIAKRITIKRRVG